MQDNKTKNILFNKAINSIFLCDSYTNFFVVIGGVNHRFEKNKKMEKMEKKRYKIMIIIIKIFFFFF